MTTHDTPQSQFAAVKGVTGPRCTETVPRTLYGPLGILPRCTLLNRPDGPHHGDHRATYSIHGIGKAVFKWKTQHRRFTPPEPLRGSRPADLA